MSDGACGERRGTTAGTRRHYRAGEKPCEVCREAKRVMELNTYEKRRERHKAYLAARARVAAILRSKYPDEWEHMFEARLADEAGRGNPPVKATRDRATQAAHVSMRQAHGTEYRVLLAAVRAQMRKEAGDG